MPKPRPPGKFDGGGLSFLDWLCSFFAWQVVHDTGATIYRQNVITGARSASRISGGHQPIDRHWVETGEWSPLPKPPTGGPTERRASIFPHFDVDVPMPQRAKKPRIRVPYRREPEEQVIDHIAALRDRAPLDIGGVTIRQSA